MTLGVARAGVCGRGASFSRTQPAVHTHAAKNTYDRRRAHGMRFVSTVKGRPRVMTFKNQKRSDQQSSTCGGLYYGIHAPRQRGVILDRVGVATYSTRPLMDPRCSTVPADKQADKIDSNTVGHGESGP